MKVTLSNLGEEILQDYKLVKKIDNNFINETIEGDVIFEGEKHSYLIEAAINGLEKETGTVEVICKDLLFEKNVKLSHKDGSFDFRKCRTTKQIKFNTPLDCVAEGEINIFDYPASETETIQGELIRESYFLEMGYNGQFEISLTVPQQIIINDPLVTDLDFILSVLGGIPNRENEGFYVEHAKVLSYPRFRQTNQFDIPEVYQDHYFYIEVYYVAIKSNTQISSNWISIGSDFYYKLNTQIWNTPLFYTIKPKGKRPLYYPAAEFTFGKFFQYIDVPISNTVDFNEMLKGVFECTGFDVVSNFFGIAPDGTAPDNKYYQYAIEQYQNLRIVESYDIIRESALEDSFGLSGLLPNKDIITDLCTMFNLLIYPDVENEIIRIEHISYFTTRAINLDLAAKDYEFGPIDLNKDQIDVERWQFAQPTPSPGFYEIAINYRNLDLFKEENEKIYKTKRIVTDVFGTLNNKDFENEQFKPLFYLLATDGTSIIELNNSLSIESLFYNLHDVNRPLKSGFVGTNKVEFGGYSVGMTGEIKLMSSTIMWNRLSPMMSVVCKYGTFLIDEVDIDHKQFLTLKIKK